MLFQFKTLTPSSTTTLPDKNSLPTFPVGLLLVLDGHYKVSGTFTSLNDPISLNLCSKQRCSSPLINFMVLLWTH